MKKSILCLAVAVALLPLAAMAQNFEFKKLEYTKIKGAPRLTEPRFVEAGGEIITIGKMGYAAPAIYDWNGDGKDDLLVGEFTSISCVRVFENIGTNTKPVYSNDSYFAKNVKGENLFITGG